jgi:hypothetical protein
MSQIFLDVNEKVFELSFVRKYRLIADSRM